MAAPDEPHDHQRYLRGVRIGRVVKLNARSQDMGPEGLEGEQEMMGSIGSAKLMSKALDMMEIVAGRGVFYKLSYNLYNV